MRCALDLQLTAKIKADEMAVQEALLKQREREKRKVNTIAFCERVGKQLEELAESGQTPQVCFRCENGQQHRFLTATRKDYADHRESYNPTGDGLDLEVMATWFGKYCFEVKCREDRVWHYGWGEVRCLYIVIAPKPECLL